MPSNRSAGKLGVANDACGKNLLLLGWKLGRELRAGTLPFTEPILAQERMPRGQGSRCDGDRGLELFPGATAFGNMEACSQ